MCISKGLANGELQLEIGERGGAVFPRGPPGAACWPREGSSSSEASSGQSAGFTAGEGPLCLSDFQSVAGWCFSRSKAQELLEK